MPEVSPGTRAAREAARSHATGRFGVQHRAEADVALSADTAWASVPPDITAAAVGLARDYCEAAGGARPGMCHPAAWTIREQFGWPIVAGERDGLPHHWNQMPDGRIFDATAAMFGDDGPQVLEQSDERYRASGASTPEAIAVASPVSPSREDFEAAPLATFFHATTARLTEGETLVPGAEIGKRNFGTDFGAKGGGNEHVYMTSDPLAAFDWGVQAAGGRKKQVKVYEIQARALPTQRFDEFIALNATVVKDVTNG